MTDSTRTAVSTIAELHSLEGTELGVSSWVDVDQAMINAFADATGDHQWIHVDVERAAKESPFGSTIAHGFLILALAPRLALDVFNVDENSLAGGIKFGVNAGFDKVRFISPLPAGGRLRVRVEVLSVDEQKSGTRLVLRLTFEREGGDQPVAVADWIQRLFS